MLGMGEGYMPVPGVHGSFQPGTGKDQETLWPQRILDLQFFLPCFDSNVWCQGQQHIATKKSHCEDSLG